MSGREAIRARGLCKRFGLGETEVVALDGVDLDLRTGELTLLKGPSGSGKSTMIAALGGLQQPDEGTVTVDEQDIWTLNKSGIDRYRRERCGFVFQSMGLFASLTAFEQIALPLQYMGWTTKDSERQAGAMLEEVGLGDRRDARPAQMSGGENQRIAIARMLAKAPRLVFADEPTSALDRGNGQRVAELLRESARRHDAMILIVTHDDRLTEHADRVLTIEDGRLTRDERPSTKTTQSGEIQ